LFAIRIKNANIRREGNAIVATFGLEAGKPEVKLSSVRLYAFTDMYVGGETYTMSIDLSDNAAHFGYSRNYYFRIGALASVSGVGTVRYNYAPAVIIPM
jgi:hypothetical protein